MAKYIGHSSIIWTQLFQLDIVSTVSMLQPFENGQRVYLLPESYVDIRKWRKESHDRWLIIDDRLYHCGHSLDANGGHKISAITLMGIAPEVILSEME